LSRKEKNDIVERMQISYFGFYCFKIREQKVSWLTDPASPKIGGLTMPKTEADVVTISESLPQAYDLSRLKNQPFVIDGPGEYEIKGLAIRGFAVNGKFVYLGQLAGFRIVHLGSLVDLEDKILEELDGVDILLLKPDEKSQKMVREIEPAIVIPMAYEESELARFCKEMGVEAEILEKLVINRGELGEETKVVSLQNLCRKT